MSVCDGKSIAIFLLTVVSLSCVIATDSEGDDASASVRFACRGSEEREEVAEL